MDSFFYYSLKYKNTKCFLDIDATLIGGMLNTSKSQIEIWFNRRKVLKIQSNELFNELLLFKLFCKEKNDFLLSEGLEKGLYVVQKTIGLLTSKELYVDDEQLHMDDFKFTFSKFETRTFLSNITYKDQELHFTKSDTLITYQTAFQIK